MGKGAVNDLIFESGLTVCMYAYIYSIYCIQYAQYILYGPTVSVSVVAITAHK